MWKSTAKRNDLLQWGRYFSMISIVILHKNNIIYWFFRLQTNLCRSLVILINIWIKLSRLVDAEGESSSALLSAARNEPNMHVHVPWLSLCFCTFMCLFSSTTRRISDVEFMMLSMYLWQWILYRKRRKKLSGLVYQQTQRKNASNSRYRYRYLLLVRAWITGVLFFGSWCKENWKDWKSTFLYNVNDDNYYDILDTRSYHLVRVYSYTSYIFYIYT